MAEMSKCPKCGGTDFVAEVDVGVLVSTDKNIGNVKFNIIKRIICANLSCRIVLDDNSLRESLVSKTKTILEEFKKKTITVK